MSKVNRRRFQPTVAELPLRIAPAVFGAPPPTPAEVTVPPDSPRDELPPGYWVDLLCTTTPDSSC